MRIVFKRENEDSPDLTFVEIEDDTGRSVQVGEWRDEGDGFHVLEIRDQPPVLSVTVRDAPLTGEQIQEFMAAFNRKAARGHIRWWA